MKLINNYMKYPPYRGGNSLGLRDILDMLITHFTIVLVMTTGQAGGHD